MPASGNLAGTSVILTITVKREEGVFQTAKLTQKENRNTLILRL